MSCIVLYVAIGALAFVAGMHVNTCETERKRRSRERANEGSKSLPALVDACAALSVDHYRRLAPWETANHTFEGEISRDGKTSNVTFVIKVFDITEIKNLQD